MNAHDDSPERHETWRRVGEDLEAMRLSLPENKTERIQIRVTPTEKEEVRRVTELLGVSESTYLMHLHKRAMRELNRKQGRRVSSKSEQGRRLSQHRPRRDDDDESGVGAKV